MMFFFLTLQNSNFLVFGWNIKRNPQGMNSTEKETILIKKKSWWIFVMWTPKGFILINGYKLCLFELHDTNICRRKYWQNIFLADFIFKFELWDNVYYVRNFQGNVWYSHKIQLILFNFWSFKCCHPRLIRYIILIQLH